MLCPNCQTLNPSGAQFCSKCKTPFATNSAGGSTSQTPFEDYLPAWMQSGAPASAVPSASRPATPPAAAGLGFSLDELLKATEVAATPTPVQVGNVAPPARPAPSSPPQLPPPSSFGVSVDDLVGARSGKAASSTSTPPAELPLPGFNEPPLWGRPPAATGQANWQTKDRPEPTAHSAYESPNGAVFAEASHVAPKAVKGEDWGVEKGFYFYTDEEGEIVLHELAGFLRRFAAAIVDGILVIILLFVFNLTIGAYIMAVLTEHGRNVQTLQQALVADDLEAAERSFADLQTFALLAQSLLDLCVSILYYVLTVVLLGGTIGHNLLGICVKSRGSGNAKLFGATVRAVYGSVPNIVQLILLPDILNVLFSILFAGALFGSDSIGMAVIGSLMSKLAAAVTITLMFEALVIVGFLWAIFDKGHQGWHDKLAGTYVVRKDPS